MTRAAHTARTRKTKGVPSEHDEQVALMRWARLASSRHPELMLLFAIPNGGKRHVVVANKLRAEGVKSGVPDLCLPVARNGYHGLYIEMKRRKGSHVSVEQRVWITGLNEQGYKAECCHGWEQARDVIMSYLEKRLG